MKKLVLALAVMFSVAMVSCGGGNNAEATADTPVVEEVAVVEEAAPATEEAAAPAEEAAPAETPAK